MAGANQYIYCRYFSSLCNKCICIINSSTVSSCNLLSFVQVDLLPEISQPPRILSDIEFSLKNKQLKSEIDEYLKVCRK